MARQRSFPHALLAALALHLVAIGGLSLLGPTLAAPSLSERSPSPIEVELMGAGGPARARPTEGRQRGHAAVATGAALRGRAKRPAVSAPPRGLVAPRGDQRLASLAPPGPGSETPASPAAESPAGRDGTSSPRGSRLTLEQLGVGARNPLLAARGAMPDRTEPDYGLAPGVERSMAEVQLEHDAKIGLGPHGPVVSALAVAVRRAAGVADGRALFDATISADGKLMQLAVVEVSGQHAAFSAAARQAASALAGRALSKPAGGRAVCLRIEVTARTQLPSGADPGLAVDVLDIPVKKGKGKKSTRISILTLPKTETVTVTTPDGSYDIPWVTQPIPGVALAGDPADIGAIPVRMVHARLVSARVL